MFIAGPLNVFGRKIFNIWKFIISNLNTFFNTPPISERDYFPSLRSSVHLPAVRGGHGALPPLQEPYTTEGPAGSIGKM